MYFFFLPTPLYLYGIPIGDIPALLCCCTPAAKRLGLGPAYVNTWRVTGSEGIGSFCSFTLLWETAPHLITEKYTSHDCSCLLQPKHTRTEREALGGWGHIPIKQMLKRKESTFSKTLEEQKHFCSYCSYRCAPLGREEKAGQKSSLCSNIKYFLCVNVFLFVCF